MTYQLVKGDQAPQIQAVLKRQDDNSVIDFDNGSCILKFRAKGTATILFTLTAVNINNNFENGIAIFSFSGDQLNINQGYYEGEIEITYASGSKETVYQVLEFYLRADF
tara:strand:+ start:3270 stop:3596 length:327 start_codon:yes stop_codon:yes gene_type:complete